MFSASIKKQGKLPIFLILGGNSLALIGSLKDARELVVETVGASFLPYVFAATALMIVLGYLAVLALVIRRSLIEKPSAFSGFWLLFGLPLMLLLIFINFSLIPAEIDIRDLVKTQQEDWATTLAFHDEPTGGMPPIASANSKVSQVWTTAQGLTALTSARGSWEFDPRVLRSHFEYIERSRIPDPVGGWGYFENFDWGVTEVASWVLVAQAKALKTGSVWTPDQVPVIVRRMERDARYLIDRQYAGGGWAPVGRGYSDATRTYSTVMVLWAFIEIGEVRELSPSMKTAVRASTVKGLRWLLSTFKPSHGWAPNPNCNPDGFSQGLSTQAYYVLDLARPRFGFVSRDPVFKETRKLLLEKGELLRRDFDANDRMTDADQHIPAWDKLIEGSTYLWFPWSLASYSAIAVDPEATPDQQERAQDLIFNLMLRADDLEKLSGTDGLFKIAENLFCLNASQASIEAAVASEEASLLYLVSHLAKALPLKDRTNPYLPYIATTTCLFVLLLAVRISMWRLKAPKLAPHPQSVKELPGVTILLPVRNEERNIRECLGSLLQSTAKPRIIVIDDSSEDATAAIVQDLIADQARVSLVQAPSLPDGWRGKVHAVSVGFQGVTSPWVLMTDADTKHHPELLARAQSTIQERGLDSLSIAGLQEAVGLGENMLIPSVFCLLDGLLGDWREAAMGESDIANGQFILVRREALESIGGLASIRNEALDDVALVERLRRKKYKHSFIRAQDLLRIRMYRGFKEAFHGWRRIFGLFLANQHLLLAYLLFVLVFPSLVILGSLLVRDWLAALVVWLGGVFASGITRASSKHSPFYGCFYPFDSLLLAACLGASWIDARRGILPAWKGRTILVEE